MADAPHEVELKFAAPPGQGAALAAAIPELALARPEKLTSIYYDTPKGGLRRAGLALRVRRRGRGFVQTLKDGGDGALARGEWEARLDGPEPDLEILKGTPAGRVLADAGRVSPQFSVEVQRRSVDVAEGDSRVEVSLDEGEAVAGKVRAPFAELELELKSGPPAGLLTLARRLSAQGDLTLSFTTKAERGRAAARPPRTYAHKFVAPKLRPQMSVAEGFRAVAWACLRQIAANAERLRHRASPEVIHQLRVGVRRLRSIATTFKKVAADTRWPALKAELQWLTGELDPARNLDVLLHGDFHAALKQKDDPEGLKGLAARLRAQRRLAYARAASAVEGERFRRLLVDLLVWIEAGPWSAAPSKAAKTPITRFAGKALQKRLAKVCRRGRDLRALDAAARHKLRIEAKKLRYAADAFAGLFGRVRRVRTFIGVLKDLQDALGDLNDIVVGERLAYEAANGARSEPAFVAGRITGAQKARIAPLMSDAEKALASLAGVRPFWK